MKKADRNLVVALAACLLVGVMTLAFSLHIYLRHDLQKDWDKPVPVDVIQPLLESVRALVYVVLPAIGVFFFAVGYAIWDYRRKRGAIIEHDKSDA
jgi:hypothetical protein